jgi:hypothetical protein
MVSKEKKIIVCLVSTVSEFTEGDWQKFRKAYARGAGVVTKIEVRQPDCRRNYMLLIQIVECISNTCTHK